MSEEDALTARIIGCAIEVHKELGPGLLESAYEECLCVELIDQGLEFARQAPIPVSYKGKDVECGFRADLIVERSVLIELKAVEKLAAIHRAQVLTYLKLTGLKRGLLINFNVALLKDGITRLVL